MATYSAIANSEIDADSPLTAALMSKIRDNPISSHKFVRRASQSAGVTNSTSLVDDGTLEFAVDASTTYAFKFAVYSTTTSNNGVRIAIDVPAGATISIAHSGMTHAGTATSTAAPNVVGAYFTTTDDDPFILRDTSGVQTTYYMITEGLATMGVTSGSIKLRYANAVTGAATTYIEAGSFLTYHRVDAV